MRNNISPEEKLLRLIRGKKQPTPTTAPLNQPKPVKSLSLKKYLSLLDIHKIIPVAFVLACIYLIISLVYPWPGLRKIALPKLVAKETQEAPVQPKQEVKPYEFYSQGIKDRQIFGSQAQESTGRPASAVNLDLMKNINLVGIISGENPQAVIEDKKTQKTYYVTKGQFIGEFRVEDIQEGKVIIGYGGQRFELYM